MLTRKTHLLLIAAIGLLINTSCKKDCVSNCIQTPMFRVYNAAGPLDSLVLLAAETSTGEILDTVIYKDRIIYPVIMDGSSYNSIVNFNEGDELFKDRDLKAMSFIFINPHTNKADTLTNLKWDVQTIKNPCHRPNGSP
ncbi:MAG TPA: hypothetical protein VEC12_09885, partial [Bacteroidia bacterium]|nr:hypothetical protein [Bacteroidia bacterium]